MHNAEPVICAMFPIGRFLVPSNEANDNINGMEKNKSSMLIMIWDVGMNQEHTQCGDIWNLPVSLCPVIFLWNETKQ